MSYWKQNQARYRETLYKQARLEIFSVDFYNTMPLEEVFTLYFEHDWLFGKGFTVFYYLNRNRERLSPYPYIRRVIWDKDVDTQRAHNLAPEDFIPQPTLNIEWREIQDSHFQKLVERGTSIVIPLFGVEEQHGRDGTTYHLANFHGHTDFKISWWVDGPPQWRELTNWVLEIKHFIDDTLGHFRPVPIFPLGIQARKFLFPPPE